MTYKTPSNALSIAARRNIGTETYTPRKRGPNEAMPNTISFKDLPVYKPARDLDQRHGIARL